MKIDFRQGIISAQSPFLQINGSGNIDLLASNKPVRVAIAHKDADYLYNEPATVDDAWKGPFDPNITYWLFWEFDTLTFERTFGYTTLEPLTQAVEPTSGTDSAGQAILQNGRMWFDTTNMVHYVYQSGGFKQVLRVFAAKLSNASDLSTASIKPNFLGTQIGVTTPTFAGRVLFDDTSNTITKSNGTFFTTESDIFAQATRVDSLRLESNSFRAQSQESNLAKFTAVAWDSPGHIRTATYNDIGDTVVGIILEDTALNEVGSVVIQGSISNPDWDWSGVAVGSELWIDSNGNLTANDPHTQDVSQFPQKRVPVARVLDIDTIVFEQGLGGVGPKGPPGSIENMPPATTTELGSVRLSTIPADQNSPVAVADNDARLSNARPPLPHTHAASEVTLTPTGTISANNLQDGIAEISNEKLDKSGGTMTGHLTLHADPTSDLHSTTKRYVDSVVSGLSWIDPIDVLNMISDDTTAPPSSPVTGDSYLMPAGTTGAWSSFDEGDVATWDGSQWVDRGPLAAMSSTPRVGIAMDTTTSPSGSFAGNQDAIAIYDNSGTLQQFYTPSRNDAVFVRSNSDVFAFYQYAYSGTQWVQFGGLQARTVLDDIGDVNVPLPQDGEALVWDDSNSEWIAADVAINNLDDVGNVNTPTPSDGQALIWDDTNSEWIAGSAGATTLDELDDIDTSDLSDGQALIWDDSNGEWIAGSAGATSLNELEDIDTWDLSDGQALIWDGTNSEWVSGQAGATTLNDLDDIDTSDLSNGQILNYVSTGISSVNDTWSFEGHSDNVNSVDVDSNGNIYSGSTDYTIRKIDPDGNEIWSFSNSSSPTNSVAVDSNDNVYGGWNSGTIRKLNSSGDELWSFISDRVPPYSVTSIAVNSNSFVYAGMGDTIRKLDSGTGNEITADNWPHVNSSGTFSRTVFSVAVDSSGNVYSGWDNGTVRKLDSAGNEIWSFEGHSGEVTSVVVDLDDNIYTSGDDYAIYKFDPSGNEIWSFTDFFDYAGSLDYPTCLTVDTDSNVYIGAESSIIRRLDSTGNEIWDFGDLATAVTSIAVDMNGNVYSSSSDVVSKIQQVEEFSWSNKSLDVSDVENAVGTTNDSSIDNAVSRFDGTDGNIQNSNVFIDDNGALYGANLKQETISETSYTLTNADAGKLLRFTSSSTITVTLPEQATETLTSGFTVAMRQSGTGQLHTTTQGSDVLNNIDGHNGSEGQHALISIVLEVADSPNEWLLDGRTASIT